MHQSNRRAARQLPLWGESGAAISSGRLAIETGPGSSGKRLVYLRGGGPLGGSPPLYGLPSEELLSCTGRLLSGLTVASPMHEIPKV